MLTVMPVFVNTYSLPSGLNATLEIRLALGTERTSRPLCTFQMSSAAFVF